MATNLNAAPEQEKTEEEILKHLEEKRNLVLGIAREDQEEGKISDDVQGAIDSFLAEIEERKDRNEINEAQYWSQIIDLYSELFSDAQEFLMANRHSQEEASRFPLNPYAERTEEVMAEAGATAKEKIDEPGMNALRGTIETRFQTLLDQNSN